jgi:hypothetical protein
VLPAELVKVTSHEEMRALSPVTGKTACSKKDPPASLAEKYLVKSAAASIRIPPAVNEFPPAS